LTLDFVQRGSCSHQVCRQLTTIASHCMCHLLSASGFPKVLNFFLDVHEGKLRWQSALLLNRTAHAAVTCFCLCLICFIVIYLSVGLTSCLSSYLQQLKQRVALEAVKQTGQLCTKRHRGVYIWLNQYFITFEENEKYP